MTWSVSVQEAGNAIETAKQTRQDRVADEQRQAVIEALEAYPEGETFTTIREHSGLRSNAARRALAELQKDGLAAKCDILKSNRKAPYEGFRLLRKPTPSGPSGHHQDTMRPDDGTTTSGTPPYKGCPVPGGGPGPAADDDIEIVPMVWGQPGRGNCMTTVCQRCVTRLGRAKQKRALARLRALGLSAGQAHRVMQEQPVCSRCGQRFFAELRASVLPDVERTVQGTTANASKGEHSTAGNTAALEANSKKAGKSMPIDQLSEYAASLQRTERDLQKRSPIAGQPIPLDRRSSKDFASVGRQSSPQLTTRADTVLRAGCFRVRSTWLH